jgi:hypothetical protein
MKQPPFSLCDFLGYLIPSTTLIFLLLINTVFLSISQYKFQETFFFVLISYALVYILSFVSSITILKKFDFHRIVTHYSFENCKENQFRMLNYAALYGYLRNSVLIFTLSAWMYFIISLASINIENKINTSIICIILILMGLSYISFMAYMKFYRRYTLESLMLILVHKKKK